jgi:hypothetical protein
MCKNSFNRDVKVKFFFYFSLNFLKSTYYYFQMPHKKRASKNHIQVKKILANSELSLLDKTKSRKSFERVPRHDNNPGDRQREERILNDDSDDDTTKKRLALKKHINKQLGEKKKEKEKSLIPKKSRKNKYFLMNHPELKDLVKTKPTKTNKRKQPSEEEEEEQPEQIEPPKKKVQSSICDKLVSNMITSRFRYLNEKLYTITSTEAQKLFQQDPQSFEAYHQGYSVSFIQTKHPFISIFSRRV